MPRSGPDLVDPADLARAGKRLIGSIPAGRLARLAPLGGEVAYDLEFSLGGDGRPIVEGRLQGHLDFECQRCLEVVGVALDAPVALVAVVEERGAGPGSVDEVVLSDDGKCSVIELVEDETILALPAAPTHPVGTCRAPAGANDGNSAETVPGALGSAATGPGTTKPDTHRPFEVLAGLERGGSKDGEGPPRG